MSTFQTKKSPDKKTPETKVEPPKIGSSPYVAQRDKTRVVPKYLPLQLPSPVDEKSLAGAQTFTFQTFIPDKYVPGTGALAYGDSRGFGKPADSFRTFQQVVVQTNPELSESGALGPPVAQTGFSKTAITAVSGHASAAPLHMSTKRRDTHSVIVVFFGSIKSGAKLAELLEAIDFKGGIYISWVGGKLNYWFEITHDGFPAYEAFINGQPIYRWCYPATSTVKNLKGSSVKATKKTGDAPGGTIGPRPKVLVQELKRIVYPKGEPYVVKPGETLSKIALYNLGAESRWPEIYDENREVIGDETHVLKAGTKLVVHRPVAIENMSQAMFNATDPQGGLMVIKGRALEYIKKHKVTSNFRMGFERDVLQKFAAHLKSGFPKGKAFSSVYRGPLMSYGGWGDPVDTWITLGTWLLGHCYPEIRYTLRSTGDSALGPTAEWDGVWFINDNLDLVGGTDKISLYNAVSVFATLAWHDILGGRKTAMIQATWKDRGGLRIPRAESVSKLSRDLGAGRDNTALATPAYVLATQKYLQNFPPLAKMSEKPGGALGPAQVNEAVVFYKTQVDYSGWLLSRVRLRLGVAPMSGMEELIQAVALYQRDAGIKPDGKAGPITLRHMFGADILSAKQ